MVYVAQSPTPPETLQGARPLGPGRFLATFFFPGSTPRLGWTRPKPSPTGPPARRPQRWGVGPPRHFGPNVKGPLRGNLQSRLPRAKKRPSRSSTLRGLPRRPQTEPGRGERAAHSPRRCSSRPSLTPKAEPQPRPQGRAPPAHPSRAQPSRGSQFARHFLGSKKACFNQTKNFPRLPNVCSCTKKSFRT